MSTKPDNPYVKCLLNVFFSVHNMFKTARDKSKGNFYLS